MSTKLKIIISIIAAVFIILAIIFLQQEETADIQPELNPYKNADLKVEIIPAPNDTYGYNILMNGRILIHQLSIPAIPGNEGFRTEEDAQRTAEFIIHKLRNNIFPPSVTISELDSLGVLK